MRLQFSSILNFRFCVLTESARRRRQSARRGVGCSLSTWMRRMRRMEKSVSASHVIWAMESHHPVAKSHHRIMTPLCLFHHHSSSPSCYKEEEEAWQEPDCRHFIPPRQRQGGQCHDRCVAVVSFPYHRMLWSVVWEWDHEPHGCHVTWNCYVIGHCCPLRFPTGGWEEGAGEPKTRVGCKTGKD